MAYQELLGITIVTNCNDINYASFIYIRNCYSGRQHQNSSMMMHLPHQA